MPLTTNLPWIAELRGIALDDIQVRIIDPNGPTELARQRGSLLFTHFGLSGPAILDVSRSVSGHAKPESLLADVDLLPAQTEPELHAWLRTESLASAKKQLAVVLSQHLPRRLCEIVMELAGLAPDRKAAALTKDERQRLVSTLKHLSIPITGTLGFKKAEVTAGGVDLGEVDSRTMQSKLVPIFFWPAKFSISTAPSAATTSRRLEHRLARRQFRLDPSGSHLPTGIDGKGWLENSGAVGNITLTQPERAFYEERIDFVSLRRLSIAHKQCVSRKKHATITQCESVLTDVRRKCLLWHAFRRTGEANAEDPQ